MTTEFTRSLLDRAIRARKLAQEGVKQSGFDAMLARKLADAFACGKREGLIAADADIDDLQETKRSEQGGQ